MPAIISTLITTILPLLIKLSPPRLGASLDAPENQRDHSWVNGFVKELVSLLDKHLPSVLKPTEEEIEKLVVQEIKVLLDKLHV